jgi:hypothetical protein
MEILDMKHQRIEYLSDEVQTSELYKYKRGGGLWIWKPYIIYKTLLNADEGDFIVYADAGSTIYPHKDWIQYFNLLLEYEILVFRLTSTNKEYSRKSLINHFSNNGRYWQELYQIGASFILVKKTERSIQLIKEWYDTMLKYPSIVIDVLDSEKQFELKSFIENRHDQSVLSGCIYKYLKDIDIKTLSANFDFNPFDGQAVYVSRIADFPRQSSEKEENFLKFYLKKLIISRFRWLHQSFFEVLNYRK